MSELSPEEMDELDESIDRSTEASARSHAHLSAARPRPQVGEYVAEVAARDQLSPAEEHRLAVRAKDDPAAREQLIERFLPLIVSLARSYRTEGLDFADLVQEGCLGLLRALDRFDAARGVPFTAFATWWIRQGLQELRSDFMRPLRIPPKALRQLAELKSAHNRIWVEEHRQIPLHELAERCGIDTEQAEALLRADAEVRSLSDPVAASDEVGMLGDILEDPVSADDYEQLLDEIAGEQLRSLLGSLSARELEIIAARFGLEGRAIERLQEIGERMGLSAERVRQLEARALAKLRTPVERA
jgi:RNA polymerase primary sigma factor